MIQTRRSGGGRKRRESEQPQLVESLQLLVDSGTRGDPMSPLRWTCKSTRTSSFLTVLNQAGQPTSLPATDPTGGWETEAALDVEWAQALAPGAQIIVVEANSQSLGDLMAAVATAANQPGVSVVSMSWGFAEGQAVFQADEALYDGVFTTPAGHQPVTFVASTGD